jgi:hypothetical protein
MICRYEDLVGAEQLESFKNIFRHCGISLKETYLSKLLEKHHFFKLSGGRKRGKENPKSHYRKGIAGDWRNHFTGDHKALFKHITGDLLIKLGYEKDNTW